MWFTFEKIEERKGLVGKSGKPYDAWVVSGTKRGFQDSPDSPYEKTIFDNNVVTVVEKGVTRRGQSLLQFFQKAVKPGDTLSITSERDGKFWRWAKIENIAKSVPTYEPLSDEEAEKLRNIQSAKASEDFTHEVPVWAR